MCKPPLTGHLKVTQYGFQKAWDNGSGSMGNGTISSVEITSVEKQGLQGRLMVSVHSQKEALAWSHRLGLCGRENSDSTQDKLKCRGERSTFAFFQWPFDRKPLLGQMRDSGPGCGGSLWSCCFIPTSIPFTSWKIKDFCCGSPLPGWQWG